MNVWSRLLFLATALAIAGLIHAFLYRRAVVGLDIQSSGTRWALRGLAGFLAVSYPLARWLDTFAPDALSLVMHAVAGWWLGLMFHLLWIGLLVWLGGLLLQALGWKTTPPSRVGPIAVYAVLGSAVVLSVIGAVVARQPARVREVVVPVKALPAGLQDLNIVVAADLHAGATLGTEEVERRVAQIQALQPDLILLPGDIVDQPPDRLPELAGALRRLQAPLGVIATTGNHEYYVGVEDAIALLEDAGMRVLVNEWIELPVGLVVAGVEDRTAWQFGRTVPAPIDVLGPKAKSLATILLNHTPETAAVEAAVGAGADLVVSGHTHGGQIWPFSYLTRLAFRYHHGLYEVGAGHQLTTCGIGWWGPPMRLGTAPEIYVVKLVAR